MLQNRWAKHLPHDLVSLWPEWDPLHAVMHTPQPKRIAAPFTVMHMPQTQPQPRHPYCHPLLRGAGTQISPALRTSPLLPHLRETNFDPVLESFALLRETNASVLAAYVRVRYTPHLVIPTIPHCTSVTSLRIPMHPRPSFTAATPRRLRGPAAARARKWAAAVACR